MKNTMNGISWNFFIKKNIGRITHTFDNYINYLLSGHFTGKLCNSFRKIAGAISFQKISIISSSINGSKTSSKVF